MSLKENETENEPNYTMRFVWATAAIFLMAAVMAVATGKFG
jgi:hypothetical protein